MLPLKPVLLVQVQVRVLVRVLVLVQVLVQVQTGAPGCRLLGAPDPPELSRPGDLVLGGIFTFKTGFRAESPTFRTEPGPQTCLNINLRELKFAMTMIFAIEEINRSPTLLPNVTLGFRIYNSCGLSQITKSALDLINGRPEVKGHSRNCTGDDANANANANAVAVIGHSGSTPTMGIARILGRFRIPVISHFATCSCLSDRSEFPSFFRTIPSDVHQSLALARLVRHFGWTWVGAVSNANRYGVSGMAAFLRAAAQNGVCVEYHEAFEATGPRSDLERVVAAIRRATSRVLVAFMSHREVRLLAAALAAQNVTGLQWVGSDAWITDQSLSGAEESHAVLTGALGFAVARAKIPGLDRHLKRLRPSQFPDSRFLKEFWEDLFDCQLNATATAAAKMAVGGNRKWCTGKESLQEVESYFTDVSELRFVNNVYKSVYAVAHAIDAMTACREGRGPFNGRCADRQQPAPWQLLHYLQSVNFSTNQGEALWFDSGGAPPPRYELINLQEVRSGVMGMATVGEFDGAAPPGRQFAMNGAGIVWAGLKDTVPVSVCSRRCSPGTRKVLQKHRPPCCYDCVACAEGEISNTTDSEDCFRCGVDFWPKAGGFVCVPKLVEFLALDELLGSLLAFFSLLGTFLTFTTSIVFYVHKETPIVRANNSELSFLLLLALALCFLCSLTFIGAPSRWSCMLRHAAFGVTFVLCISCVLGKTMVVLMAFRAKLPGSHVMKWLGPAQQRLSVVAFTLVQVGICSVWLAVSPPFPVRNLSTYKDRIILECDLGSAVGFWAILGYVGLLAVFCFVLATLARKLPDNFNEAKFITFSMLIFCAVWIAFIPAYVSSPGKFTVAVEIFAILASSYGMLICIFFPKCYIILFRPEQNTKKHVMAKTSEIRY